MASGDLAKNDDDEERTNERTICEVGTTENRFDKAFRNFKLQIQLVIYQCKIYKFNLQLTDVTYN